MASRVNTKFVVILIVAVIAMLGMLFAAYSVVYKTAGDLAAKGDEFAAEGKYDEARKAYARAVNKDQTIIENLEKWIHALENWIPETETAYYDAYRKNYLGAIRQASLVQRTNVEAYKRELGIQFEMLQNGYSRGFADSLVARTTTALGFFDGVPGVDPGWETLKRYRCMSWERIGANGGIVDEFQYELINEDFESALAANPADGKLLSFYMRWMVYEASNLGRGDRRDQIEAARVEAISRGESFLAENSESPSVLVVLFAIEMEKARSDVAKDHPEKSSQRTQSIYDTFAVFREKLTELHGKLMQIPAGELDIRAVQNYRLIDLLVNPGQTATNSISLYERLLEGHPQSSIIMISLAEMYASNDQVDRGMALFEQIVNHESIPISIEGVQLFDSQRTALVAISSIYLDKFQNLQIAGETDDAELDRLIQKSVDARDRFSQRVAEDNNMLMLLDGRISYSRGDTKEALRLFKTFNGQQKLPNARGLWFEAVAAQDLDQLGTAKDALLQLVALQQSSIPALLRLAHIETRLQNYDVAKLRYESILVFEPSNRIARDSIARINAFQDPSLIDDPVESLFLSSRRVKQGDSETTGDLSAAITLLSEGIESVNYAPRITQELASLLVNQGDIAGARDILSKAVVANPDDEGLAVMREALRHDDAVDILVEMVSNSPIDEMQRLLSIARIAIEHNRQDLFGETVDKLVAINPTDSSVIDLSFIRAISTDAIDDANSIAKLAQETNSDGVNGMSYQARLASYTGDHPRAIQLLEQITSNEAAEPMFHRMLAMEYQQVGRTEDSIASFEQALSIKPDDTSSILEYLRVLSGAGMYPEALDTARRFQRYANSNPVFVSMWLSLESGFGGPEGQSFAIKQREKFLELNPTDEPNRYALASLYVEAKKWSESRVLIDELKAEADHLRYVNLEATWYANQGRVGELSGLGAALKAYTDYIEAHKDEHNSEPHIALATFMIQRGRPDIALQAASDAVANEDPDTLMGTKLLGNLFIMSNQYANAADAFKKVVETGADEDDKYRSLLIDMLTRTRQFESAKSQFDLLDESMKNNATAMIQESEIEDGLGNRERASDIIDETIARFPNNSMAYIKRAEFNIGTEGLMTDVLADVDAALQINPKDWRAYKIRASAYFNADQKDAALRDLQKAVRFNPSLDQALFGILNEFIIEGNNAEAYDFAVEITQHRKQDATLAESLGDLFASRGDWDHAAMFFKLAWNIKRSPLAGATLIDALLRTRNPDTTLANAVIKDLAEVAGDINSSPGLLAAQALVLQARGRDELALQQLTKAFDLSSNDDNSLLQWSGNISRFFETTSMQDQLNYLETLKQRNLNQEVINWLDLFLAQRLISSGAQLNEAFQVLDRLSKVESQPRIQQISLTTYGAAMYSRGELDKAIEIWSVGSEKFPDDWEMSNNLAYLLSVEKGEHERALELALNVISSIKSIPPNKRPSEPYDTIGKIYIALGEYDEAQNMLATGMKFALSAQSRITLVLAQIELDLARGMTAEARSKLVEIRSLLRSMPTRSLGLEKKADDIEIKIDSHG